MDNTTLTVMGTVFTVVLAAILKFILSINKKVSNDLMHVYLENFSKLETRLKHQTRTIKQVQLSIDKLPCKRKGDRTNE